MAKFISPEEKKYQRKLIPLNLIIAILALVASLSLLFAPLLSIDMSKVMDSFTENGTETQASESSSSGGMDEILTDAMNFKLSISTVTFAKLGFASEDEQLKTFVECFIPEEVIENIMVSAVSLGVASEMGITDEEGYDLKKLNDGLKKIDSAKNKTEFQKAADEFIGVIEQQSSEEISGDVKDELKSMLDELYDNTVKEVGANNFSLESFVCVTVINMLNDNAEEGATPVPMVTTYNDLFVGVLDGTVSMGGNSGFGATESITQIFDSFGSYFIIMFAVMTFFALIWFILFLFAFIKMFTKNKRFLMWYAKLFGATPCLLFGVLPLLAGVAFGEALGAEMTLMLGAITSFTWISGGCYLLMWIFSICWAFPIKRKIRKIRKGLPV